LKGIKWLKRNRKAFLRLFPLVWRLGIGLGKEGLVKNPSLGRRPKFGLGEKGGQNFGRNFIKGGTKGTFLLEGF